MARSRLLPDNFTLALVATVVLASVAPASGMAAAFLEKATVGVVALLFFMHGAKLSREAVLAGLGHWRLHLLVVASTFVLFLCVLPATVQSAIAFTAVARGNMAAAICSASASTLMGIVLTPVLVGLVLPQAGSAQQDVLGSIGRIMLQLLLPFVAGHLLRPWIGPFIARNAKMLKFVDQGSVLLVVYTAFSAAVVGGLWRMLPLPALAGLVAVCAVLLAAVLGFTTWVSRRLGFSKEDEITIVFCGSKKSLLSASQAAGMIVLPLMIFHQMQLMVCAVLAQRYAKRS
jgi:sodium/bile acid cotransporter 7